MADELDTVITNLTTVLEGVEGVKAAHETPLEGYNEFPMAVVWLDSSRFRGGAGSPAVGIHKIQADVYLARSVLPSDVVKARPYVLRVWAAVAANTKLSGACEYCLLTNSRGPGTVREGDGSSRLIGVHFEFDVKVHHTGVTFTA